jgi:membrane-associated phospholipid phosphatase
VTLLIMLVMWTRLVDPKTIIVCRVQAVAMLLALWAVYRMVPCRFTHLARIVGQLGLLGLWYPDTYEFNRVLPNLDHLFAQAEQSVFGCQPALTFARDWSHPLVSELLSMGYVSYYPLIALVGVYYFVKRYAEFDRAVFTIISSFFLFYIIFIFLPVAGPQFYYMATGLEQIEAGVFPNIGHYFEFHQECLPIPGWEDGFWHKMVIDAHDAGERPTAAFPSSHVGVTTVLLWLAWRARCRWLLFTMLPFAVLMFFGTFYIQAHYAIDAIAGIVAGSLIYFLCQLLYSLFPNKKSVA